MNHAISPHNLSLSTPPPNAREEAVVPLSNSAKYNDSHESLALDQAIYEAFFTTSSDLLCITNAEGQFYKVNAAFEQQLGYAEPEIKGTSFLSLVHPDDTVYIRNVIASLADQTIPSRFSIRYRRKDGDYRWLAWQSSLLKGTCWVYASARDITEKVEVQESSMNSEDKFRLLAENTADIVMLHRLNAEIDYVSPSVERILGYSPEELLGTDPYTAFIHPDDVVGVRKSIYQALLAPRKTRTIECRVRRKSGTYGWFESTFKAVKDEQQQIVAIVTSSRDVSDRRQEEERAREFEQRLLESNEELENFAYVASHDLQEPLRVVSSFLQVLQRRYQNQLDERAGQFIHYAVDGANRMKRLITDLLTYSRITNLLQEAQPVNLNVVLAQIQKDLQLLISGTNTTLHYQALPTISGSETLLYQVFLNLISNAIKFRAAPPPRITIGVEKQRTQWLFSVADNGMGISADYAESVFDIFTRLNGHKYEGTGMGLSIVKKVIENYRGTIRLTSAVGKGTTFYFTLPRLL